MELLIECIGLFSGVFVAGRLTISFSLFVPGDSRL